MRSTAPGNDTSDCEVTHISSHGIWLFAHNEEFFMSCEDFPWFKKQPIEAVLNVEEPSLDHYSWPAIDEDLTKEIIKTRTGSRSKAKVT